MIAIKHRFTNTTLCEFNVKTVKYAVIKAVESKTNLSGADLSGANLSGADLSGADLRGANLYGAKNAELLLAQTSIVPEEGAFVGYKKLANGVIAKLVIPHDAKRLNAYGSRK